MAQLLSGAIRMEGDKRQIILKITTHLLSKVIRMEGDTRQIILKILMILQNPHKIKTRFGDTSGSSL